MTVHTVQTPTVAGTTPTYAAVGASDSFIPKGSGKHLLHVKNAGASPDSVAINDPTTLGPDGATQFNPDVTLSVPNAQERMFIIDPARFTNPATGAVEFTNSFTTSVTAGVFYIG